MKEIIFLGDEATAAGFRLAGLSVRPVPPGGEPQAFAQALAEAALLLVGAGCAARLPAPLLQAALAAGQPPLLVLPERLGDLPADDPAAAVRRLLGMTS